MKWGKTDNPNPNGRYSSTELNGGRLEFLEKGNIVDIKRIERELSGKIPGPDNNERWVGKKKGQSLSAEAERAKGKAHH